MTASAGEHDTTGGEEADEDPRRGSLGAGRRNGRVRSWLERWPSATRRATR